MDTTEVSSVPAPSRDQGTVHEARNARSSYMETSTYRSSGASYPRFMAGRVRPDRKQLLAEDRDLSTKQEK